MIADPITLHQAAVRFGPAIRNGWMDYNECFDLLCRAALRHPQLQNITPREFEALTDRLWRTMSNSVEAPSIAAELAIKKTIWPMLAERLPKSQVMLAAYRAAGNDLAVEDVERIATETVREFLAERELRVAQRK